MVDVSDVGERSLAERVEEDAWLPRLQTYAPGMDPRTNAREHNDLVATAAGPDWFKAERDLPDPSSEFLGGEKTRILFGMPDVPVAAFGDPWPPGADMFTPIGTPEGARPEGDEVW